MWIFCGGMRRSGSTLQFQLAAHLVEEAGRGRRIAKAEPEDFPRLREEHASTPDWKVFKTHICTPEMAAEFQAGNASGVYVFRDVRDVMVSRINRTETTFEATWRGTIDSALENFQRWTSLEPVLVSRYEEMVADVAREVRRIARHLDIPTSREHSEAVAAQYTPERQRERIREAEEHGRVEQSLRVPYDPVSHLHVNHIRSGQSGQWSTALSRAQLAMIEDRAGSWLTANGYRLALPRWQRAGLKAVRMAARRSQSVTPGRRPAGSGRRPGAGTADRPGPD